MLNEKHDLVHELPEHKDAIHHLKMNDNHFARLFNEYHDLDHEVHRLEMGIETVADDYLEAKKFERLKLKDELFAIILKNNKLNS